jgi:hypothetical protein
VGDGKDVLQVLKYTKQLTVVGDGAVRVSHVDASLPETTRAAVAINPDPHRCRAIWGIGSRYHEGTANRVVSSLNKGKELFAKSWEAGGHTRHTLGPSSTAPAQLVLYVWLMARLSPSMRCMGLDQ